MIRELTIKNYKSILDLKLELGRINLFIGENGCGKTNILEAMAMAAAAVTGRLDTEELYLRGVRVAKPAITLSSFTGVKQGREIEIGWRVDGAKKAEPVQATLRLTSQSEEGAGDRWLDATSPFTKEAISNVAVATERAYQAAVARLKRELRYGHTLSDEARRELTAYLDNVNETLQVTETRIARGLFEERADDFLIYNANQLALRGLMNISRKEPLGIHGENLDVANEGILHALFYLTLFISDRTPRTFGIDNIETALNPRLCRNLIKQLAELSVSHDKQALITTHNPAALDGLDLHDDEQRLFVVSRNDAGHTVASRIKLKPPQKGQEPRLMLSEMWMRGHLGGIPLEF